MIRNLSLIITLPLFFILLLITLMIDWYNDCSFHNSMTAKLDVILLKYDNWYNKR